MLKELMSEYDQDPTNLLDLVMRVPPRLSKSIVYLVVMLLQQQKLLESILMVTELRTKYDAGAIRNTKNGQNVKEKKKRTKTRKPANVKNDNENAENRDSMAFKGSEEKNEQNQTEDKISKTSGSAESNAGANPNHLVVSKSKKKKESKKKKAGKASEIAGNKPGVNIDQPAVPPITTAMAKKKAERDSESIMSNAGAIIRESGISGSNKEKAKEKIDNHSETAKNNTRDNIKQHAIPKSKKKIAKTNKRDGAADNREEAKKTQPESATGSTKTQNNNKVDGCSESDKGKKKAQVSQTTNGEFFSIFEIECMKRSQARVERGIKDCQEGWNVVQKMEEALTESKRAKARQMQAQEQKKSAEGG